MKFKWNELSNKDSVVKGSTTKYHEDTIAPDKTFCNTDKPTCTNRGKDDYIIKLCWDTMNMLKYDRSIGGFYIGLKYYNVVTCKKCKDYYLIKCSPKALTVYQRKCMGDDPEPITCYICQE
jgi:hypothetical protein